VPGRAGAGRLRLCRKDHGPFIYQLKGTPAEYQAIPNGWPWLHEAGAALLA
jgi:hypothetical protein